MKKLILAAACGFLSASLSAAEKSLSFTDAAFTAQINAAPAVADVKIPEAPKPARGRAGHYVQVSGYVTLNGNGFLSGTTGGYTSVTLNGWATFRDSSGQVTSNNSYISVPASMWIYPNQYVFQTVYPNVYAQFYNKGAPVGSTSMSGSISVNGWPSGNYVTLNGSGNLTGSIYVEDAP